MNYQKIKLSLFVATLFSFAFLVGCNNASKENSVANEETKIVYDTNSPKSMLIAASEACGGMDKLKSLKDVEYDYNYVSPDGKRDISKERYIFDNETSWAKYTTHEINVPEEIEGDVIQMYDGENTKVYNNGTALDNPELIGTGQFLRQANYMWFTMMFKLTDPGIIYKYEGQKEKEGKTYDIVNVTYDPKITGKEQNDTFILYIDPETHMVESFYFSLPAFGMMEPVLHAQLTYENIDGIQVITKRIMTAPSPDGNGRVLMVDQQLKNIKFNNGFTTAQLSKEII